MPEPIRVALIGLDTSHTVAYAELMNAPAAPADQRVDGLRAVACLRFDTPFQSTEGLNERQRQLEAWGIPVTTDFDAAVADCDAIMLEINDPALHLEYFRRVAGLGKPIFVDKPLCATIQEAREMLDIAWSSGAVAMACSPLRSSPALLDALAALPEPQNVDAYGVLGTAPAGSSIVWYGCHTAEMVQKSMGEPAVRVNAMETPLGCVAAVEYESERQALIELGRPFGAFGGRLQKGAVVVPFAADLGTLYYDALLDVRAFFRDDANAGPLPAAFEVMALLDAIERSLERGSAVPVERIP